MRRIENILFKNLTKLGKNWFILLAWLVVCTTLVQIIGIPVHEFGHYSAGRIFGCNNLTISLAKFSLQESISNVSGWEYCETPLITNRDGSRVCNNLTNAINFSGLGLSLLIFIPLAILINLFFKLKSSLFHLSKHFFWIIIMFIISTAMTSAVFDLFKIGECLFNSRIGESIFRVINIVPNILILLICLLFLIDILHIIKGGVRK